jgi:hypothetical protein
MMRLASPLLTKKADPALLGVAGELRMTISFRRILASDMS